MTIDDLFTFTADAVAKSSDAQSNDFAITIDIIPRNSAGEAESRAGSVGTPTYRFQNIDFAGTMSGSIMSAIDNDLYNFYVKDTFNQNQLQEQPIYKPGNITLIKAKLAGTQASPGPMIVDIENDGAQIVATGNINTLPTVSSTWSEITPTTATIISGSALLALSIIQVGTTNAGNRLNVQVQVARD